MSDEVSTIADDEEEIVISNEMNLPINRYIDEIKDGRFAFRPINQIGQITIHSKTGVYEHTMKKAGIIISDAKLGHSMVFKGLSTELAVTYTELKFAERDNLPVCIIGTANLEAIEEKRTKLDANTWAVLSNGSCELTFVYTANPVISTTSARIKNLSMTPRADDSGIYDVNYDLQSETNIDDDFVAVYNEVIKLTMPDIWENAEYNVGQVEFEIPIVFIVNQRVDRVTMDIQSFNTEFTASSRVLINDNPRTWAVVANGGALELSFTNTANVTATTDSAVVKNLAIAKRTDDSGIYDVSFDLQSDTNISDDFVNVYNEVIKINAYDEVTNKVTTYEIPVKFEVLAREASDVPTIYFTDTNSATSSRSYSSGERHKISDTEWAVYAEDSVEIAISNVAKNSLVVLETGASDSGNVISNAVITPRADSDTLFDLTYRISSNSNIIDDYELLDSGTPLTYIKIQGNDVTTDVPVEAELKLNLEVLQRTNRASATCANPVVSVQMGESPDGVSLNGTNMQAVVVCDGFSFVNCNTSSIEAAFGVNVYASDSYTLANWMDLVQSLKVLQDESYNITGLQLTINKQSSDYVLKPILRFKDAITGEWVGAEVTINVNVTPVSDEYIIPAMVFTERTESGKFSAVQSLANLSTSYYKDPPSDISTITPLWAVYRYPNVADLTITATNGIKVTMVGNEATSTSQSIDKEGFRTFLLWSPNKVDGEITATSTLVNGKKYSITLPVKYVEHADITQWGDTPTEEQINYSKQPNFYAVLNNITVNSNDLPPSWAVALGATDESPHGWGEVILKSDAGFTINSVTFLNLPTIESSVKSNSLLQDCTYSTDTTNGRMITQARLATLFRNRFNDSGAINYSQVMRVVATSGGVSYTQDITFNFKSRVVSPAGTFVKPVFALKQGNQNVTYLCYNNSTTNFTLSVSAGVKEMRHETNGGFTMTPLYFNLNNVSTATTAQIGTIRYSNTNGGSVTIYAYLPSGYEYKETFDVKYDANISSTGTGGSNTT